MGLFPASARRIALRLAVVIGFAFSSLAPSLAMASSPLGPNNAQRRALAVTEMRHLLTLVALPPGSRALARWNAGVGRTLRSRGALSADPDQVDLTRFYLVAHGASALAWIERHVPRGGEQTGWGTGSGPGTPTTHTVTFSFATSPPLAQAQLQYAMVITPAGELGLRVDSNVLWTPRKSRFSLVASGATKVVVTMDRGLNVKSGRVTTVLVSRRATIAAIRATINALPVAYPGVTSCPVDVGALMSISFWRPGATSAYAVAAADPGGCGSVTVTAFAADGAILGTGHDGGGWAAVRFVATSLSIRNWTDLA